MLTHAPNLRHLASAAIASGISAPALCSTLAYFDSYITDPLPTNLIQAQRDYFGAHSYQRNDKDGQYRTDWDQ
jgi:6-phosphogluconate dehydrogenase